MLPALKTWQSREQVTAAKLNEQVRDVQAWLQNPPLFQLVRDEALTVTGGTVGQVPWNSAALSNGFTLQKDSAGNITGLLPKVAGRYKIHAQLCGKLNAAGGHFCIYIRVNGVDKGMGVASIESAAFMDSVMCTAIVDLKTTDVVTVHQYVSSGRTGYITNTAEQQLASSFLGYWIGATT
ncbi:hypothetical protein [Streptomyces californicus]|uniref:hypothetical protein n=1 Tax=Streptomyces californicus TaxID=67351 RepID=UPI0036980A35